MRRTLALLATLAAGCTPSGAPERSGAVENGGTSDVVYDGRSVPREPLPFTGTCRGARPMGALSEYDRWVRTLPGEGGFVRVRADASWPGSDLTNVLGELSGPMFVPAFGPLKGVPSNGLGYAVPLQDPRGRTCKGYLSATVVRDATAFE